MKRTGCPARSCPRELRAKGAGVQYVHRFDHTCRIVSFPVGKRYDFGFADSRAFCFLHGEGAPYPACACMEILHGASPAPVCVSHRLCVIPRRGPGPKQVFFSHTGPRRPRRTLPQPAPESGCPRRPRPLRNGRAFAPNRYGSPGPDRPGPKQVFFSRTGPRRPRRTLPRPAQSPAARAGRVLCATGAPLRRTGTGPRARTV